MVKSDNLVEYSQISKVDDPHLLVQSRRHCEYRMEKFGNRQSALRKFATWRKGTIMRPPSLPHFLYSSSVCPFFSRLASNTRILHWDRKVLLTRAGSRTPSISTLLSSLSLLKEVPGLPYTIRICPPWWRALRPRQQRLTWSLFLHRRWPPIIQVGLYSLIVVPRQQRPTWSLLVNRHWSPIGQFGFYLLVVVARQHFSTRSLFVNRCCSSPSFNLVFICY